MGYKQGLKQERELVKLLYKRGFMALRCAGSGAGTNRPLPDVMAGNRWMCYGIEVKSSSADRIWIKDSQLDDLKTFCEGFGAVPRVCVKFSYLPFAFFKIDDLLLTREGNRTISREQVAERLSAGFNSVLE